MLNLFSLKYFCDAVRLDGISASAKANFVTQSAVSQGIAKLEKELGIDLVAHHPNRFKLTPAGEIIFRQATDVLRQAEELKTTFSPDDLMGSLDFASTYSIASLVLPKYLKRFRKAYPHVKINFHLRRKEEIQVMLKRGLIDFGITNDDGGFEAFDKKVIYQGRFGLYTSTKVEKLDEFITAEPENHDVAYFRREYQKKFGKAPPVYLEVQSWEVIANITAQGLAIGHFPDYIAKESQLKLKPYDLDLPMSSYEVCAFFPPGMTLRPSSQAFLSYF